MGASGYMSSLAESQFASLQICRANYEKHSWLLVCLSNNLHLNSTSRGSEEPDGRPIKSVHPTPLLLSTSVCCLLPSLVLELAGTWVRPTAVESELDSGLVNWVRISSATGRWDFACFESIGWCPTVPIWFCTTETDYTNNFNTFVASLNSVTHNSIHR